MLTIGCRAPIAGRPAEPTDAGAAPRTETVDTPSTASSASSTTTTTTAAPVAITTTQLATTINNPVYDEDFPDPYIVTSPTGYVAFSTNSRGRHVPVLTSTDLVRWTDAGDALPVLPTWATANSVWAPAVTAVGDRYLMYVTVGDSRRGKACVFAATSSTLTGPYSIVDEPVTCAQGGSIDPSVVHDTVGNGWLVWKDEVSGQQAPRIRTALLSPNGLEVLGTPTTLVTATSVGGDNIEGPTILRSVGGYTLFFSVGDWKSSSYRTGYATCDDLTTECHVVDSSWLSRADGLDAPGGLEVFSAYDGTTYAVFHTGSCSGCSDRTRVMNIKHLTIDPLPALT
jgi:hypothetical protein